ncbi:hypothetical protein [Streptomyces sp. 8L]|uniref:hypothetical protein n=1 Tax=Streptomyces sp. 8L TaxID=2877242 RepID=UPI001CD30588|nr:hypothetical protein [Streptomyces sp. 8L]MCA1218478.1 hypothetical protein [Streptomyces sp. 8L]
MLTRTRDFTAQKRPRRVRSRAISTLPPLVVSTLKPHEVDLAYSTLVCPTCRTWVPINAPHSARPKLVPHHTEKAGTEDPIRCPGSHRLVTVNLTVDQWFQRLEEGLTQTDGRRSARVVRKPKTATAPAVMQIVGGTIDDKTARQLDEAHVRGCSTCSIKDDKGNILRAADITSRCTDGRRLAQLAAHTKRLAPTRRKAQMDREDWNDRRAWGLRLLHEQQWQNVSEPVADADLRRVRDTLAALIQTLNPCKADAPQLTDWERADLMSAITLLATQEEQLTR